MDIYICLYIERITQLCMDMHLDVRSHADMLLIFMRAYISVLFLRSTTDDYVQV